MSCSFKGNLLRYSQSSPQNNLRHAIAEKRVTVLVLCVCMIALQGSNSGVSHVGMTQQSGDELTENIALMQKQFFSTFNSEITSRG